MGQFFDIEHCYDQNIVMRYFIIIFFTLTSISQAEITLRKYNDRYCYDGDTCYVTIDGENTKIRLLELDTPECLTLIVLF